MTTVRYGMTMTLTMRRSVICDLSATTLLSQSYLRRQQCEGAAWKEHCAAVVTMDRVFQEVPPLTTSTFFVRLRRVEKCREKSSYVEKVEKCRVLKISDGLSNLMEVFGSVLG